MAILHTFDSDNFMIYVKGKFITPVVPRYMTCMPQYYLWPPLTRIGFINQQSTLVLRPVGSFITNALCIGYETLSWNILPTHIRNSQILDIFKTNIKQYLFIYIIVNKLLSLEQWQCKTIGILYLSLCGMAFQAIMEGLS